MEEVFEEIRDHLTPDHFIISVAAGKNISWM